MPVGGGAGSQRRTGAATGDGSGLVSKRIEVMSTPETPSTSAWWVFEIIAQRGEPSASGERPSTMFISQSGFERSSCWAKSRPPRAASSSSPPGAGSALWRTW